MGIGGTSASGSGDNNSTLRIANTSRNRFWESLEKNIKDMLRETDKLLPEGSSETFVSGRGQTGLSTTQASVQRRAAATTGAAGNVAGAVGALATTPGATQAQQSGEYVDQRLTFREAASVIVNPEAGIVTVRAASRQHEKVAEFIEQVSGAAKRQVLISATIVEVELSDQYQAGVDWSAIANNGLGYTLTQSLIGANFANAPGLFSLILQTLIGAGMGDGPALALLLAGPALSLPSMLVIHSYLGTRKTLAYVGLVVAIATLTGWLYGAIA